MVARSFVAALAASAGTLAKAASIDHDAVVGFPQTVPSGTTGDVYLAYQPTLYVVNGCVPFPAVDAEGNTNAGLNPSGSPEGNCSSSPGQIYVRGGTPTNGSNHALMYSWYMPKDEPSTGIGHRHDWEGVIVWLRDASSTSADNILAVCPSAHGGWDCSTDGYTLGGSAGVTPFIKYQSVWPVDHSLGLTSTQGGTQPLIAWESLPDVSRNALEDTDFGAANVPFKEANFQNNLAEATF